MSYHLHPLTLIDPSLFSDKNPFALIPPPVHIPKTKIHQSVCDINYNRSNNNNNNSTNDNTELYICKYVKVTFPMNTTNELYKIIDQIKNKENVIKMFPGSIVVTYTKI